MISTLENNPGASPAWLPAEVMLEQMLAAGRKGFLRRRFRGAIWDYARTIWLGSGYLGDWALTNVCRTCRARGVLNCRHFEIDTARHLIGPFRAIADPNVRIVMLLKAAQTAGSLVWDLTVHFLLVHSSYMRIKVLMDSDEKARVYCTQRLMETLKANPDIAPLLPTGAERFGVTDTELRLKNGKTLFVGGLNDRNASSLPADVMILDEGWLHQSDGLLKKAFERLKQTKHGKIIIVGQAGKVDEDQDVIWKSLHARVPLTFACPCCAGRQEFSLTGQRPEDFTPKLPIADCRLPIAAGAQTEIKFPTEPPKPGTYWGMKVPERFSDLDTPEKIKAAAARTTIECYHCGFEIQDTPVLRRALNDSFEQEYQLDAGLNSAMAAAGSGGPAASRFTPPDYSVGFWQPDPASMFVPFRSTMESYIKAKKAHSEFGNSTPLIDFYQSNWATAWDERSERVHVAAVTATIDPLVAIPNERFRTFLVDCQKDIEASEKEGRERTGHFWCSAEAVDVAGNTQQLWRGYVTSWREVVAKYKELKIPVENVLVDARYVPDEVREQAALNREIKVVADGNARRNALFTWKMLAGSARNRWLHADNVPRIYSPPDAKPVSVRLPNGQWMNLTVPWIEWSNFHVTNQLDMLRKQMPGKPRFVALPPDSDLLSATTRAKEQEKDFSYDSQMNGQVLGVERGKPKWVDLHKQQHYADCAKMGVVIKLMAGLLGAVAAPEEGKQEV